MLNTILVHVNKSSVWIFKFFTIVTHLDILPRKQTCEKVKGCNLKKTVNYRNPRYNFYKKKYHLRENTSFSLQALDFCRDGH